MLEIEEQDRVMEKHEIYIFLKEIQAKITSINDPLDGRVAYEMVDQAIRDQEFYQHTPYFLSEWIIVKDQVFRNDSESIGYLDSFIDSILYSGDIGLFDAYLEVTSDEGR